MTESFKCASCSAPLDFEGKTVQKCRFCGSTVIVPTELLWSQGKASFGDLSSLTGKAFKIAEIQQLIHNGEMEKAGGVFRETFRVGHAEAKAAVERMAGGESVDITGVRIGTTRSITVGPEFAKAIKKIGLTVGGSVVLMTLVAGLLGAAGLGIGLYYALSGETKPKTGSKQEGAPTPNSKDGIPKPDAEEILRFGGEGNGAGRFRDNRSVAVDGDGWIYSSDYSPHRIQVFDSNGKFVNQWNPVTGTNLYDLVADRDGNVFIANNKGLFKHHGKSGNLLKKVTNLDPRGLALAGDGKIIVSAGSGIQIFDKDLNLVGDHRDAAASANASAGFDGVAADGDGMIYAVDRRDDAVCKFSPDGKFLDRFQPHPGGSVNSIAVDPKGRIFVSATNEINVFDSTGRHTKTLKTSQAFGIAFNLEGEMFVASRPNVLKYRLNF